MVVRFGRSTPDPSADHAERRAGLPRAGSRIRRSSSSLRAPDLAASVGRRSCPLGWLRSSSRGVGGVLGHRADGSPNPDPAGRTDVGSDSRAARDARPDRGAEQSAASGHAGDAGDVPPRGVLAKSVATLDALSGGRAFCGIGAGWWEREHHAFGLAFPAARARLDALETTIETMRALWAKGTKADAARESLCQRPRATRGPKGTSRSSSAATGSARRYRIAARAPPTPATCRRTSPPSTASSPCSAALRRGRARYVPKSPSPFSTSPSWPATAIELADLVEDAARADRGGGVRREQHHAGTATDRSAATGCSDRGVRTVFVALPDLAGPDQVAAFEPIVAAFG